MATPTVEQLLTKQLDGLHAATTRCREELLRLALDSPDSALAELLQDHAAWIAMHTTRLQSLVQLAKLPRHVASGVASDPTTQQRDNALIPANAAAHGTDALEAPLIRIGPQTRMLAKATCGLGPSSRAHSTRDVERSRGSRDDESTARTGVVE